MNELSEPQLQMIKGNLRPAITYAEDVLVAPDVELEKPDGRSKTSDAIEQPFERNLLKFGHQGLSRRSKITRMTFSKRILETVEIVSTIIEKKLSDATTMTALENMVYVGAITTCNIHGKHFLNLSSPEPLALLHRRSVQKPES
ncbi:hypothetical protein HHI36_002361 [Cryptolaemus montrouzieri]|uniref:Uncharacterized protein n=1 Tax=Cryptolaemus montrouzieri TaxID=559131 RepID=A0ABD2PAZ1_9CUCU